MKYILSDFSLRCLWSVNKLIKTVSPLACTISSRHGIVNKKKNEN